MGLKQVQFLLTPTAPTTNQRIQNSLQN